MRNDRAALKMAAVVVTLELAHAAHAQSGFQYDVLHSFSDPAHAPRGSVALGSDGALYGTTGDGGAFGYGTVFKVNADGTGYAVLHDFDGKDGAYPSFGLIAGADGFFYGLTSGGPCSPADAIPGSCAIAFRIALGGSGFRTLRTLPDGGGGSTLVRGWDGYLYGTTSTHVFRMARDGSKFWDLTPTPIGFPQCLTMGTDGLLYVGFYLFTEQAPAIVQLDTYGGVHAHVFTDGIDGVAGTPVAVTEGTDGFLYAVFVPNNGVPADGGQILKIARFGSDHALVHEFGTGGSEPSGPWSLIQGADGSLYGVTSGGGALGGGAVFKVGTDGSGFATLRSLGGTDGNSPLTTLVQAASGTLYGTAGGGAGNRGVVFGIEPDGSTYSVVHAFAGTDPADTSALLAASDGALYGTTADGGADNGGVVFRVGTDGTGFTVLHDFAGSDGFSPGMLIEGADGLLYGTAGGGSLGSGVVFKMAPDGSGFATLHDFEFVTTGGALDALVYGTDGVLYGTAEWGGVNTFGTLFKLATDGSGFALLRAFDMSTGGLPGSLLQGPDGALYGAASFGGPKWGGAVFRIETDGTGYTILDDSSSPLTLVLGPDGFLYGTSYYKLFKTRMDGGGTTLLRTYDPYQPLRPPSRIVFGADGALYGPAAYGLRGYGSIDKTSADGARLTAVHTFTGGPDGASPSGAFARAADGALYAATSLGGGGGGTLVRLASPVLSVSDASVAEGDAGTTVATVTVSLVPASTKVVKVAYLTANGTATAGADYVAKAGSLSFAPGQTTQTIGIAVKGDTLFENDETFSVTLRTPTNATIGTSKATVTIENDDAMPALSIASLGTPEGPGAKNVVFAVTLSKASSFATTVHYQTADGTATAGSDYVATAGTLTIPAGALKGTIPVAIKGDATYEGDETVSVVLDTPVGATIAQGTGVATLVDDDGVGQFAFAAAAYTANEAAGKATVVVTRANGLKPGTVQYATADGTAVAGADYAATAGTLSFAAGQKTATLQIPILNDTLVEGPQTFSLSLSNPQPTSLGAALGPVASTVVTIADNDAGGTIQFAVATARATESAGSVKLTLQRTGGLASPVSVHYATTDGTATGGVDYDNTGGDVTFDASGPGATTTTLVIPIAQDTIAEGPETFTVTLSAPTGGAALGTKTAAIVTIVD